MNFYVAYDMKNKELPITCGNAKEMAAYFNKTVHCFRCAVSRNNLIKRRYKIVKFT